MSDFLLLLHDPDDSPFQRLSPEEMQNVIARYGEWAEKMAAEGRLKGGHKLEDGTARHITRTVITDGPFPETKEVVGGYFLITAADYEEAVQLATTCPHVDFGRIEIRRIEAME